MGDQAVGRFMNAPLNNGRSSAPSQSRLTFAKTARSVVIPALGLFLLLASILAPSARADSDDPDVVSRDITIAVLAYNGKKNALHRWQPTADYLTHHVPGYHFSIEPLFLQELGQAVADGRAQLVLTQPLQFVQLAHKYDIWPLATLNSQTDGHKLDRFGSAIICRANRDDLTSLADLKGKMVAGVAPDALGGWLVGIDAIDRAGVNVRKQIDPLFVGLPMQRVAEAVLEGRVDAGIIRSGQLERLTKLGIIKPGQVKVLGQKNYANYPFKVSSELVPEWPIAASPKLPRLISSEVARALLAMSDTDPAAKAAQIFGWTLPLDYSTVEQIRQEWLPSKPSIERVLQAYWPWLLVPIGIAILIFYLQGLRTQRHLANRERQLRTTFNTLHDAVVVLSANGMVQFANKASLNLMRDADMRSSDVQNKTFCKLFSFQWPNRRANCDIQVEIDRLVDEREIEHELIAEHGRQHRTINIRFARMDSNLGTMPDRVLVSMQDVTELRDATALLSYRATHDRLTGLINRIAFEEILSNACENPERGSCAGVLIWIDIDDFKLINETISHQLGDQVICRLASHISMGLPPHAVLARMGVDEFSIWIPGADDAFARQWPMDLLDSIRAFRMDHTEGKIRASASIGVCIVDYRNAVVSALLRDVESASRSAHRLGGNRVFVHSGKDEELQRRRQQLDMLQLLKQALDEDQFCQVLQKIEPVHAEHGLPEHWEVLLRLRQPDNTLIFPGQFIEVAEKFNFMPEIDRWVVRATFAVLSKLDQVPPHVAINLSGASVQDPEMANFIRHTLNDSGLDPRRICFEITETTAISNFDQAVAMMGSLRALGCQVSLDDFGGGLLSFEFLRQLQPDFVKIDGKLVRDMLEDPVAEVIVGAIHRVATVMGAQTIGEWVESQELYDRLRAIGVDYVQGYLVHRPEALKKALARNLVQN